MKLHASLRMLLIAFLASSSLAHAVDLSDAAILKPDTQDRNLKFSGIAESKGTPQHITLVDSGIGALQKRLEMINSAKHTIDI